MRRAFSAVSISVVHIDHDEVEIKMLWGFEIVEIAVNWCAEVMRQVNAG